MDIEFLKNTDGIDNKDHVVGYFEKYERINNMNEKLIKITNGVVNAGYGEICSGITIILFDKTQDDILNIYKLVLKKHNLNLNDVYITYFRKCNDDNLNLQALKNEFEILGNTCFYLMHGLNIRQDGRSIVSVDYDKYIRILDNEGLSIKEINILKNEFYKLIEKSIKYLLYKKENGLC